MTVAVLCQGSHQIGLGHVTRCLFVTHRLMGRGRRVIFITNDDPVVRSKATTHRVEHLPAPTLDHAVDELLRLRPAVVLTDCNELGRAQVAALRAATPVINLAPQGPAKWYVTSSLLHCPVLAEERPNDATSSVQGGPRFAPLAPELRLLRPPTVTNQDVRHIVISMGGADAAGLTFAALDALRHVDIASTEVSVVAGAAFAEWDRLEQEASTLEVPCHLERDSSRLGELMAGADVGLLAMGTTAYEACAVGLASVNLCPSPFHARLAAHYEDRGMLLSAGEHGRDAVDRLAGQLERILGDADLRLSLRRRALELVDGRGVDRIVERVELLSRR